MATTIDRPTLSALRVLSLAYFVQATGALSVVGALDVISAEWALTDTRSAYLISAFGISFALAAPLLQVVFGHWRRRRQVLIGLALFGAAALAQAAAPDYATLLSARVLMGLGAGFIGPVLGALGSGLVEREQQGPAIATVLLGLSVASLAGLPLAAWAAHAWGVRPLFVVVGSAGLATAWLIRRAVPDRVPGEPVGLRRLGALIVQPRALAAFLVAFFIAAAVYAALSFLAPVVRDVYGAGPGTVSLALAVLGEAGVLGNLFVTRLSRRFSAQAMLYAGIALAVLALIAMRWAPPRLGALFATLALFAFAADLLWPSQQRRIVELNPQQRGLALALTASFIFAGIGFGSALAGWIYPSAGYGGVTAASTLLLVLAAVCLRGSAAPAGFKGAATRVCPR
ncbi:MAG: MFS transporter [Rubrivivax sp.]